MSMGYAGVQGYEMSPTDVDVILTKAGKPGFKILYDFVTQNLLHNDELNYDDNWVDHAENFQRDDYKEILVPVEYTNPMEVDLFDNTESVSWDKVLTIWNEFATAFEVATYIEEDNSSLSFYLEYQREEDGDIYDEVKGFYLDVLGVKVFSLAAKSFISGLKHYSIVNYG